MRALGARRTVLIRAGWSSVLAALFVLALSRAPATAESVWLPPIDLAGGTGGVGHITASMSGRGDAVVAWREKHNFLDEMSVHAAVRSGGVFGAPTEISPPDPDGVEPDPQVVLDESGNALALWKLWPWTIELARRPAGGAFGTPVLVDGYDPAVPDSGAYGSPHLAIAPTGNALITWMTGSSRFLVHVIDVTAAGALGPSTTISQPDDSDGSPRVAFGPHGEALLAWNDIWSGYIATAALRTPGGAFSAEVPLSNPSTPVERIRAVIDAAGDAIVTWVALDGPDQIVEAAIRPAGGVWSRPVPLSDPVSDVGVPEIATGGDGITTIVWSQSSTVQAATRLPGGAFGRPIAISDPRQNAGVPQIAAGADGTTIATWARISSGDSFVQAATRPPGGVFGRPVDISPAYELTPLSPQATIGDTGDALVVWSGWDARARHSLADAAAYDASPPQIDGISAPATTTVGIATQMFVATADISSDVSTTWSFGDGTVGEGDTVTHEYVHPGSYEVRVTATDAAGKTATAMRSITVSPPPPPRLVAPVLSRLRFKPAAFCVGSFGRPIARTRTCRTRAGSEVWFRLDTIARVTFAVERRTTGRRVRGRCVKTTHTNHGTRPCARNVRVHGTLTRSFPAGNDGLLFTGRLHGHALMPGRYVLIATPSASGSRGESARARFRILG
jgi:hypothetical protein